MTVVRNLKRIALDGMMKIVMCIAFGVEWAMRLLGPLLIVLAIGITAESQRLHSSPISRFNRVDCFVLFHSLTATCGTRIARRGGCGRWRCGRPSHSAAHPSVRYWCISALQHSIQLRTLCIPWRREWAVVQQASSLIVCRALP